MKPRDRLLRFEALYLLGCICCVLNFERVPTLWQTGQRCEIHHQNQGGYAGQERVGDEATVPLCLWHHRGVLLARRSLVEMTANFGPSLARSSKSFRRFYGTDAELLELVNSRLRIPKTRRIV